MYGALMIKYSTQYIYFQRNGMEMLSCLVNDWTDTKYNNKYVVEKVYYVYVCICVRVRWLVLAIFLFVSVSIEEVINRQKMCYLKFFSVPCFLCFCICSCTLRARACTHDNRNFDMKIKSSNLSWMFSYLQTIHSYVLVEQWTWAAILKQATNENEFLFHLGEPNIKKPSKRNKFT